MLCNTVIGLCKVPTSVYVVCTRAHYNGHPTKHEYCVFKMVNRTCSKFASYSILSLVCTYTVELLLSGIKPIKVGIIEVRNQITDFCRLGKVIRGDVSVIQTIASINNTSVNK